jgi:hypothetical protein
VIVLVLLLETVLLGLGVYAAAGGLTASFDGAAYLLESADLRRADQRIILPSIYCRKDLSP